MSEFVRVEVGGIQGYILESDRLRDMRGASARLAALEAQEVPGVVRKGGGALVRHSGGVTLARVPAEAAAPLAADLERTYRAALPGAGVYVSRCDGGGNARDALARSSFAAASSQGLGPSLDAAAAAVGPLSRPCDACGRRAAAETRALGAAREWVCGPCKGRGEYGGRVRSGGESSSPVARFAAALGGDERWAGVRVRDVLPDTLDAIAGRDDLALILADGNALGRTLRALDGFDAYTAFSAGVADAVARALFTALADHGPRDGSLPWEILYLGGDDVLLAARASIALPLTLRFIREVEERTAPVFERAGLPDGGGRLTLAAGVAVARPKTPIRALRELAGELERSAKTRAYDEAAGGRPASTVDFQRVTGGGYVSLAGLRHANYEFRRRAGTDARLTGRPFTADELSAVCGVADAWRAADVPSSQLATLRDKTRTSPAEAMLCWATVVGRARPRQRQGWLALADLASATGGAHLPFDRPATDPGAATWVLDVADALDLS